MGRNHETTWGELFDAEVEARTRVDKLAVVGKPTREALHGWWASVQKLLFGYAIAIAKKERPEPPPGELASVLAGLAGYLAVGQIPDPIRDVKTEGRRRPGPAELSDIGWAVAYRRASRPKGLRHNDKIVHVVDKWPVKTLAGWFGVDPNTIRGWLRRYPQAFLGVNDINADVLRKRARKAGERYVACGRGAKSGATKLTRMG